jgi:hypothetical protein
VIQAMRDAVAIVLNVTAATLFLIVLAIHGVGELFDDGRKPK